MTDGRVTYVDEGPFAPLEIARINLTAHNIRNIRSKDRTYPSDLHVDAVVFETGRVTLDGHADFLAVPVPGVRGDVKLEGIALDYFKPVLNHGSVAIQGGTLDAAGAFEYGPSVRMAKVMKNVPRKEVATEIDISGRLDNPRTSTVQAIVKLIQNAFIKAILPGFDREVRESGRSS